MPSAYSENYKLIDFSKELPSPPKEYIAPKRSDLPAPMIMGDTIEPTRSMADGKYYTSKAAIRATYKPEGNPNGNRYVEVGNEELKPAKKKRPDRKTINDTVDKAFARAGLGA